MLDYASRLLSRREYARDELLRKMRLKWARADRADELAESGEDIGQMLLQTLDELEQQGLLSDQRFAEAFVRSRMQRGQGPVKIRTELKQRGIDAPTIAVAFEQLEHDWVELAESWLLRQLRGQASTAGRQAMDYADRGRYYRRLVNRGFSHDQAMSALDRVLAG